MGSILTPAEIWSGFIISKTPTAEIIDEQKQGNIISTKFYVNGQKTKLGQAKIYCQMVRPAKKSVSPTVVVLQALGSVNDGGLSAELVKNGYAVVCVDISGKTDESEFYTVYPEDICYANYQNVKDSISVVVGDAQNTCWYEWGSAVKYVLEYVRSLSYVGKVGGIGVADSATVLWQVASTEKELSAAIFLMNNGWKAYLGNYKYSNLPETDFADDMLKYVAGIEPQSYASYVKCPCLMLTSAMSRFDDCDRGHDTAIRINKKLYRAVYYSRAYRERLDHCAYVNTLLFLDDTLKDNSDGVSLPADPDIECEVKGGVCDIEVSFEEEGVKSVSLYVSEDVINPYLRSWIKLTDGVKRKKAKRFTYTPSKQSSCVMMFADVQYKSGFTISSKIISKKLKAEPVQYKNSGVLYSGRKVNAESIFFSGGFETEADSNVMDYSAVSAVTVKEGPMGIDGVYSKGGLTTCKINAPKDKPADDDMLIFDVHMPEDGEFTVKIIVDGTEPTVYMAKVNVRGGNIWSNYKLEINRFKTEEGKILKSFKNATQIVFGAENEYILNNVLWV